MPKSQRETNPPLTKDEKKKRLEFAKSWFHDGEFINRNVIWMDQVLLKCFKSWSLVRGNDLKYPKNNITMAENMALIWGCMSKTRLIAYESLVPDMDLPSYWKTIERIIVKKYQETIKDGLPCVIIQEANSIPTELKTRLEKLNIPLMDLPSKSSDLNPMELVWGWLMQKLETDFDPCDLAGEVEENLYRIWRSLGPEYCPLFVGNMENRLRAVIEAHGDYTKYCFL
jgi:hypothetical protein